MKQARTGSALAVVLVLVLFGITASSPAQAIGRDPRQGILRAAVKLMTPFEFSPDAGTPCSGIVLNPQGYLLTSFRCVGYPLDGMYAQESEWPGPKPGDLYNWDGISIVAVTGDPRRLPVPTYIAQVIAADPAFDLAVLKIKSDINGQQPRSAVLPLVSLPLADSDSAAEGDAAWLLGYPGDGGGMVSAQEGKIIGLADENQDGFADWIKTDVPVSQGGSGSALIDSRGELIGIATGPDADASGNSTGAMLPVNNAISLIRRAYRAGESTSGVGDAAVGSVRIAAGGQNIGLIAFGDGFEAGNATHPAIEFPNNIGAVHAAVPYQAMRDGMRWGYVWQLDGKTIAGESDLKWKYGPAGTLDIYIASQDGLPNGTYKLLFLLNDTATQDGQLTVGNPQFKSTPQKPSDTLRVAGVTVTGLVIDHSTRQPIQGAAVAFLYPGTGVRDYDADNSKSKAKTVQSYGVTNANGVFTTDTLLAREQAYSVIVSAQGYQRIAGNGALNIASGDPDVIELDPIELDRQ